MSWESLLNSKISERLKDPDNPGKDLPDPRIRINTHLVLNAFLPRNGWYTGGYVPVSITIENTGNAPSYNAAVGIYAGRSSITLSEFKCITTFTSTLYPGEKKTIQEIKIEQKKLPYSGPLLPLLGGSKALLVAVIFDPFLMSLDKSKIIDEIMEKDFISGGMYQNNAIRTDGAILFGYKEI
jgi:hypothetical protein